MAYTELQVTSNFSFLQGASHPDELVEESAILKYSALAITDHNTMAGIVRAHTAAKAFGIRLIVGCRLNLTDGPGLLAFPTDAAAYGNISTLLSTGNMRAEKGRCDISRSDLAQYAKGSRFIVIPPATLNRSFNFEPDFERQMGDYHDLLGNQLYIAASHGYMGDDRKRIFRIQQLAERFKAPMVATNDVHYHNAGRRQLQDVLTCIRNKCTITTAGYLLHPNAERHLKTSREMERLFRQYPDAIARTQEIAEAARFSLDQLTYVYPREITREGRSPQAELEVLAWEGAHDRYGQIIPQQIQTDIRKELDFIERMEYAPFFLTVYDVVRYCKVNEILCQGRGSAANSTVCFVTGITSVDPTKFSLLFERFASAARREPPDIDLDIEHERREEVIQYLYNKYGRHRAAIIATVTQQRTKGAILDVGKAMGLSTETTSKLGSLVHEEDDEHAGEAAMKELGLNAKDPHLQKVLAITRQYVGFPRQLGQHVGGFVITDGRLSDLCPVFPARMENRSNIEWNKDDIDELGFVKVDVLALGMLTCIRKSFQLLKAHYGRDLTLATVPQDDPAVYKMISAADTIGVFQIESRAQMSMLPRLAPKTFYDLVVEVAIVRPGPIQGNMVHPYLRRRMGLEPVSYPSPELEQILGRTLGIPLFQEQAMKIAIVAAGFTAEEADLLRRSMASFKVNGTLFKFEKKLVDGMTSRGYDREFAQNIFEQLKGFGSYGFPESHAASFALLVYISAWIKCHYPDVFACALLNAQPMGFYAPAQIVADARRHGVEVLPVDVNISGWDNTLEPSNGKYHAMRLGLRQVKGVQQAEMDVMIAHRKTGYQRVSQLRDAGVSQAMIEKLAEADAFRSIGIDRRRALWEAAALTDRPTGMFAGQAVETKPESQLQLPLMTDAQHVVQDYATTSLSLKAHPLNFLRPRLEMLGAVTSAALEALGQGAFVKLAGLVLVRQRPPTAKNVTFITLEDESGSYNLIVYEAVFEKFKHAILQADLLLIEGKVQREQKVMHIVVSAAHDISKMLAGLSKSGKRVYDGGGEERPKGKVFPGSRDFK
ncbi:error-prone DNA polymerase [Chitinophaga sp. NPDC101104]|uniref:error-prone DNA polymerase n=1 Tax=Chitinophaga sp. NPDC101104 TaxID=3390561 RepID=UPI003D0784C2